MNGYYFCVDDEKGKFVGFIKADSKQQAEDSLKTDNPTLYKQGAKIVGIGIEDINF